jgi:hypothetical protein
LLLHIGGVAVYAKRIRDGRAAAFLMLDGTTQDCSKGPDLFAQKREMIDRVVYM